MFDAEINHMDANEIFLDVICSVSSEMLNDELSIEPPEIVNKTTLPFEITSMINISGAISGVPFEGLFALSWQKEAYVKMANAMLMEDYTEICEDNMDAGCELTNIIFGNCKPKFNSLGFTFEQTIPILTRGSNIELLSLKDTPSIITLIDSSFGQMQVILSMKFNC